MPEQFYMGKCKYPECDGTEGTIETKSNQDCLTCNTCNRFQRNVSKVDSGRKPRTVKTTHDAIKTSVKNLVLHRCNGFCELCGKGPPFAILQVSHIISVEYGHDHGLTDDQINDQENLIALCDECNLGGGKECLPLRFALRVVWARLGRKKSDI